MLLSGVSSSGLCFFVLCVNYVHTWDLNGKGFTMVMDDSRSMGAHYVGFDSFVSSSFTDVMMDQITECVLVSFNEQEQHVRTKTTNARTMKQDLMNFRTRDHVTNSDCSKNVLSAIELGMKESQNSTYIMVVTNAPAKDLHKLVEIKSLCQEKQIKMDIALTRNRLHCDISDDDQRVTVYSEIESACQFSSS